MALRHEVDLARVLVSRDVRLRYRRSVLGMAWSQIAPLAQLAILSFLFSHVVQLQIKDYPVFLFVGLLPWLWFADSLVACTGSVIAHRDLIRKPSFPVGVVPVLTMATQLVYFVLALPVLFTVVAVVTGRVPVEAIALPVILATQFLVCLGPCYVLAAVNIRFRDMTHLVAIAVALMFYATPIFYSDASVPDRYRLLYDLNPMTHLIVAYRAVFLNGQWPDFPTLALLSVIGAVGARVGYAIYRSREHEFYDEL